MKFFHQYPIGPLRLILCYFVFFFLFPSKGFSQHPYALSLSKEIPLFTAGAGGTVASILLRIKNKPLTAADLGMLNASDIFAIDQSATGYYGREARIASDVFLSISYAFPLATLLLPDIRSDPLTIGVMLGEAVLINEALTGITKAVIQRPRPFTYNQDLPENIRTKAANDYSFFSGHTSYTATLSFFTAKVISDNTDHKTVKIAAWTGAFLWPAATGYFRYKAGMHFPTDVITGYAVGAAIGYFVPQLHKKKEEQNEAYHSTIRISSLRVGPGFFQAVLVF